MSLPDILEALTIGPLKLLFSIVYEMAMRAIGNPGLAIICLSIAINLLILPLYLRADSMQMEVRDTEAKLEKGVTHIKKMFVGNERMMMLQTYYRQNNYKPTQSLKGTVSLLLEIPFFIAAYQFLFAISQSNLSEVSFGPISDLSKPDGLISFGGLTINLLPILMTVINCVSSAIYLKGFPIKTKVQLYVTALVFLVFLYSSPASLVFYWTLNNLFSLIKNIVCKLKNPKKFLTVFGALFSVIIFAFSALPLSYLTTKKRLLLIAVAFVMCLPILRYVIKKKFGLKQIKIKLTQCNNKVFLFGSIFLTVFVGALIPSTFIAASPQEYVDISNFYHPIWYVINSLCLSIGVFLVWCRVIYWMLNKNGKTIFERIIIILCVCVVANYMFFGTNLGIVTSDLQFENGLMFSYVEKIVNTVVIVVLGLLVWFVVHKKPKITATVVATILLATSVMSVVNVVKINRSIENVDTVESNNAPSFTLSKNGKNVAVIVLDRAMGSLVPYLMNENPKLKEQYAGFVYYDNTISFGSSTNIAMPAVWGGYEYTPVELNKRKDENLMDKHNESLKVLPVLFSNNNYNVTVFDPTYANYQWISDLSIYNDFSNINAYNASGRFIDYESYIKKVVIPRRQNMFLFSVMKSSPVIMQNYVYLGGTYYNYQKSTQVVQDESNASGINLNFSSEYSVLDNLKKITKISNTKSNNFMIMSNDTTHEVTLLKEPEYKPEELINNTDYDIQHKSRFNLDGAKLNVKNAYSMMHYHSNMAALLQIGKWLDYLRENDVYDNTKIIIVSDHGFSCEFLDEFLVSDGSENTVDIESYFPLLMVKDFNSKDFTISHNFMTNADTATLATQGTINNPLNPFTDKPINNNEKYTHDQFISRSNDWRVEKNNGNTFLPSQWISVKDSIRGVDKWSFFNSDIVLDENSFPKN